MKRSLSLLLSVLLLTLACSAWAQPSKGDEEKGRELAGAGMQAYKDGDYTTALEKFDEARAIYPAAQVLRIRGYTLLAMERWLEAADAIEEALEAQYKPLMPRDAEHAQDNLKAALSKIAIVKISSRVRGATVTIDGGEAQPLPFETRMLPGEHTFEVAADRYDSVTKTETLKGGKTYPFKINPKRPEGPKPPPPPPPPPPEPDTPADIYGWFPYQGPIGLAVAGVGIIVGGVAIAAGAYGTQLRSSVQQNIDIHNQNYDTECSTNRELCLADIALINHDGERAHEMQQIGLYTGIAAGVLVATGVTFWLFADDGPLAPDEEPAADDPEGAEPGKSATMSCAPIFAPSAPGQAAAWQLGAGCTGSF